MPVVAPTVIVAPTTKPVTDFNYVFSVLEGAFFFCQLTEDYIGVQKGQRYQFMGSKFEILEVLEGGLKVEVTGGEKKEIIRVTLNKEVALEEASRRNGIRKGCDAHSAKVGIVGDEPVTQSCDMGSVENEFLRGLDVSEILLAEKFFGQFFNNGHFVTFIPASESNNFTNSLIVRHNNMAWVFAELGVKNQPWDIPGFGTVAKTKYSWRFFTSRLHAFGLKEETYDFDLQQQQQDLHTRELPLFAFKVSRVAELIDAVPIDAVPIDAEPIDAEPIYAEPIYAEPTGAEPTGAEPIYAEPTYAVPTGAEPTGAEPIYAEPTYAVPTGAEPTGAEPIYAEPIYAEPTGAEPIYAEPIYAEPIDADPTYVEIDDGANGEDVEASHNGNEDAVKNVSSKKSRWSNLKSFFSSKRKSSDHF